MLESGVLPVHARRAARELEEHYEDLVDAGLAGGKDAFDAHESARAALGDLSDIRVAMAAQDTLKAWAWRWPRLALVVYPVAFVLALPAAPVYAGIRHAPAIGRWLACLLLGGVVTLSMFLFLELAIMTGSRF